MSLRGALLSGAAVSAIALTAAGTPSFATSSHPSTSSGAAHAATSTLRVGTFNIEDVTSPSKFNSALNQALNTKYGLDVLALQEVNSTDKEQDLWGLHRKGYSYWRDIRDFNYYKDGDWTGGAEQTPFIWRTSRFTFDDSVTTERVPSGKAYPKDPLTTINVLTSGACRALDAPPTDLHGEVGSGWKSGSHRWSSIVRLTDNATGRQLSFIDVHLIWGMTSGGRKVKGKPLGFAVFKAEVKRVVALAQAEQAAGRTVFVLGDFNDAWASDNKVRNSNFPVARFARIGFKAAWTKGIPSGHRGTRGHALLDSVYTNWTTDPATSAKVLFGVKGSDHKPAEAVYNVHAGGATGLAGTIFPTTKPPTDYKSRRNYGWQTPQCADNNAAMVPLKRGAPAPPQISFP